MDFRKSCSLTLLKREQNSGFIQRCHAQLTAYYIFLAFCSNRINLLKPKIKKSERSMASNPTQILMGVNESSSKSHPHASISSRTAFDWTVEKIIRDNVAGFKIQFVHVQIPDEDGFDDMDSIYASPEDFARVKKRDKARGLHLLEYFVERCHRLGIACEAWIKKGDPKEVLCSEVKRVHPDLLVVGSRGLGPFHRVFVGTVSEFCVKHAECPVISIKRKAEEAPQDPIDD